jgi:SAM-dependent methyltransferase
MYLPHVSSFSELRQALDVDSKMKTLSALVQSTSGRSLLDVGCGMGGFLIAGRELGMQVSGFEPSAQHASILNRLSTESYSIVNDYFSPSKSDQKYDVVLLSHVIEHIFDQRTFIQQLCDQLSERGRLIVITPNNESLVALLTRRWWVMYKPVDHVGLIGPAAAKMICPKGARVLEIRTIEYAGEFAIHILSAFKSMLKPQVAGLGKKEGGAYRLQTSENTIPKWLKNSLAIVSWLPSVLGKLLNRRACMTVVYTKRI